MTCRLNIYRRDLVFRLVKEVLSFKGMKNRPEVSVEDRPLSSLTCSLHFSRITGYYPPSCSTSWASVLVAVGVALEGTLDGDTKVVALLSRQLAELRVDVGQVQERDLLVEDLRQDIDTDVHLSGLEVT